MTGTRRCANISLYQILSSRNVRSNRMNSKLFSNGRSRRRIHWIERASGSVISAFAERKRFSSFSQMDALLLWIDTKNDNKTESENGKTSTMVIQSFGPSRYFIEALALGTGKSGSQRWCTRQPGKHNESYRITCSNERKSSIKSLRRYDFSLLLFLLRFPIQLLAICPWRWRRWPDRKMNQREMKCVECRRHEIEKNAW